jgi:hypothetical protein
MQAIAGPDNSLQQILSLLKNAETDEKAGLRTAKQEGEEKRLHGPSQ